MSVEEYQELGRQYYKQQQYKKAVEAFTEGIEAAARPSVGQLDQRAASYDKLNDLNAALKDGRDMIRIDKKDAKGYLRTGSILQKLNKLDKALDIYKYGMKNVPVDNKDFKVGLRLIRTYHYLYCVGFATAP
jgi:F-box/TPR repeat protein Pof3